MHCSMMQSNTLTYLIHRSMDFSLSTLFVYYLPLRCMRRRALYTENIHMTGGLCLTDGLLEMY